MKERPILFSAPMVRALLGGTKTQTRRAVNPQQAGNWSPKDSVIPSPYGRPGDRLWVRESFRNDPASIFNGYGYNGANLVYRADAPTPTDRPGSPWRPSIYMPRWASRITLEITRVRGERLQAISNADARAEGIPQTYGDLCPELQFLCPGPDHEYANRTSAENFAILWDSINGKRGFGWASNPWVWVIEFRRVE